MHRLVALATIMLALAGCSGARDAGGIGAAADWPGPLDARLLESQALIAPKP